MRKALLSMLLICTALTLFSCDIPKYPSVVQEKLLSEHYNVKIVSSYNTEDFLDIEDGFFNKFGISSKMLDKIVMASMANENNCKPLFVMFFSEEKYAKRAEQDINGLIDDDELWKEFFKMKRAPADFGRGVQYSVKCYLIKYCRTQRAS